MHEFAKNKFLNQFMVNWMQSSRSFAFVSVCTEKAVKNREFIRFNRVVFYCKKEPKCVQAIARDHFGIQFHANCHNIKNLYSQVILVFVLYWVVVVVVDDDVALAKPATIWFTVSWVKLFFFGNFHFDCWHYIHIGYILYLPLPRWIWILPFFTWNQLSLFLAVQLK